MSFGRIGNDLLFSYIRLDTYMQAIPSNAAITSANMKLTFRTGQTTGSTGALWRLTQHWYENSVNCNSAPSVDTWWQNQAESPLHKKPNGHIDYYDFDITALTRSWKNGTYPYYGVCLTYTAHSVNDYNSIASSEDGAPRSPVITFEYEFAQTSGITDGAVYYIKSVRSGKYMDVEGGLSNNVWQYNFNGTPAQQWKLVFDRIDGYYSIVPLVNTSYRLDIVDRTDANGKRMWITANDASDAQKFKIISTGIINGAQTYKIQPKISTTRVLDVYDNRTASGTNIHLWNDLNQNNQKWVFEKCSYNMTMNHYCDEGYITRFSNAINGISSYQSVCSSIFQELFGLHITSTVSAYRSCADDCKSTVTSANLTASCSHNSSHLTATALRNNLVSQFGNGTPTLSRYTWTGHLMDGNASSNSSSSTHTVVMTIRHTTDSSHNNRSNAVIRQESIFTLLHETSHQIGAPDHYCYGRNGNNNCSNSNCTICTLNIEPPICLMTQRMPDIETRARDTIYCSKCSWEGNLNISKHLSNHH